MSNDSLEYNIDNYLIQEQEQNQPSESSSEMKSRVQSACFFISSIFIVYVFIFSESQQDYTQIIVSKEREPMFDQSSQNESCQIFDAYDGSLDFLNKAMESSQLTVIYFYANWCARSHKFKGMIEALACQHSKDMPFVAINCYYGACREAFELAKYPFITLQVRNVGTYTYQGPYEIGYISRYLEFMSRPLTRIDNLDEFINFIIQNDYIVVGHFDFSTKIDNELFKIYYRAAYKTYHTNFENPIRYTVILNQTLINQIFDLYPGLYGVNEADQKITVFSIYGLHKYFKFSTDEIDVDRLTMWVKVNVRRSLNWNYPDKFEPNKNNRSQMLIFTNHRNQDNFIDKEFAIAKIVAIEHRLQSMNIRLPHRKNRFLNLVTDRLHSLFDKRPRCSYRRSHFYQKSNIIEGDRLCTGMGTALMKPYRNSKFMKSFDIYLVDKSLYSNYASHLLNNPSIPGDILGEKPNVLFADYKNESLYLLDAVNQKFNYKNLRSFIENQSLGTNPRKINSQVSKQSPAESKSNVKEISSKQLTEIFSASNKDYHEKDLLVFYYASWCGHCKLSNFKLIKMMHQYFKNVDSIKLLKVDCGKNDLPWHLQPASIPTVLFKPMGSIETIQYPTSSGLTDESLLELILFNARSSGTIIGFLEGKAISSNKSEFKVHLAELIKNKLDILSFNRKNLHSKISSLISDGPQQTIESFYSNSSASVGTKYDQVFLTNVRNSLVQQLETCVQEISLLKQFDRLF